MLQEHETSEWRPVPWSSFYTQAHQIVGEPWQSPFCVQQGPLKRVPLLSVLRPWAMLHQRAETTAWVLLHPPTWTAKWPAPGELLTPTLMVRILTHGQIPLSTCIMLRNYSSWPWISRKLNRSHDRAAWLCKSQSLLNLSLGDFNSCWATDLLNTANTIVLWLVMKWNEILLTIS